LTIHELHAILRLMIQRTLEKKLKEMAGYYPVVMVTGPRQSGKTTLCRMTWPGSSPGGRFQKYIPERWEH